MQRRRPPLFSCCLVLGSCLTATARAIEFTSGEIEGRLTSQLSIGASWSTEKADNSLIAKGNGGQAFSSTMDDGRLNFDKGDSFSEIFKGVHELSLNYRNFGSFFRGKYWYDRRLKDSHVNHGHGLLAMALPERIKSLMMVHLMTRLNSPGQKFLMPMSTVILNWATC